MLGGVRHLDFTLPVRILFPHPLYMLRHREKNKDIISPVKVPNKKGFISTSLPLTHFLPPCPASGS